MSEKFIENVWLETESCYKCGIVFAMPAAFVRKRRYDNQTFYCPSGHGQIYSTNQLTKLRRELEQKEREQVELLTRLADTKTRLSHIAKAHTKMRSRIVNGVCPCCNRTFQNLMQHMKTEHPDFNSKQGLLMLRTAFGLTQYDVAKEIGVNAFHVSCFERGKSVSEKACRLIEGWVDSHNVTASTFDKEPGQ